MTNVVFVTGSTIADAVSQVNVAISAEDYISDLTFSVDLASGQGAGSTILAGFVKNNGHFGGFRGHKGVTCIGNSAATAADLITNMAPTSVNHTIVDMQTSILGSDTTGSVVYFGMALQKNYN